MTDQQLLHNHRSPSNTAVWLMGAIGIILLAVILSDGSKSFGYDRDVIEMPIIDLVVLLVVAGAAFFAASQWALCKPTSQHPTPRSLLVIVLLAGTAARLILFPSTPALEDDYQRYLWDGAVAAQGLNPYEVAPETVWTLQEAHPLRELQQQSGTVLERINHPHLTTIYPPVAQAAFALAYKLQPFSLTAWRTVLLLADLATLALLVALLKTLGRSPLWASLYWWNPLVLKEMFNSAHMDVLIFPFLLGGLLLALQSRPKLATASITVAAGVKLWPLLMLPLVWRRSVHTLPTLAAVFVIAIGLLGLWMWPIHLSGLSPNSGLVAYASGWVLNSPLYKSVVAAFSTLLTALDVPSALTPSLAARGFVATVVSSLALAVAWPSQQDTHAFLLRALIVVTALVFLSPAIYPWYTVWLLPLLVLVPQRGLLLLTVTIPLYYCYFYFAARDTPSLFHQTVVWFIWAPVWALTLFDICRNLITRSVAQSSHALHNADN